MSSVVYSWRLKETQQEVTRYCCILVDFASFIGTHVIMSSFVYDPSWILYLGDADYHLNLQEKRRPALAEVSFMHIHIWVVLYRCQKKALFLFFNFFCSRRCFKVLCNFWAAAPRTTINRRIHFLLIFLRWWRKRLKNPRKCMQLLQNPQECELDLIVRNVITFTLCHLSCSWEMEESFIFILLMILML